MGVTKTPTFAGGQHNGGKTDGVRFAKRSWSGVVPRVGGEKSARGARIQVPRLDFGNGE